MKITESRHRTSQDYEVEVGFGGYVGVSELYSVSGFSREDAEKVALDEACWDLDVVNVKDIGDGEYEVEISPFGCFNCSEVYTVYADDEEEAEEIALDDAKDDLTIIDIDGPDDPKSVEEIAQASGLTPEQLLQAIQQFKGKNESIRRPYR